MGKNLYTSTTLSGSSSSLLSHSPIEIDEVRASGKKRCVSVCIFQQEERGGQKPNDENRSRSEQRQQSSSAGHIVSHETYFKKGRISSNSYARMQCKKCPSQNASYC